MKPTTTSMSPYQIRLELLQLAQIILSEKHKADGINFESKVTTPTTSEIIAEANKMNEFVSQDVRAH